MQLLSKTADTISYQQNHVGSGVFHSSYPWAVADEEDFSLHEHTTPSLHTPEGFNQAEHTAM